MGPNMRWIIPFREVCDLPFVTKKIGSQMSNVADASNSPADDDHPDPSTGPLIFISHDSRDAQLAEAFSKLLASVTAGMLKTFRSSDRRGSQGFEFGVEWYPELMKRLAATCDVVCLLTEHSLERPWILYEAGVAKGKLDMPVHGLAVGVPLNKASSGPFAQFQNCDDDVDSLTKLVIQLIRRLPHADPDQDMVRSQVEIFITAARNAVESGNSEASDAAADETSPSKLFEEVKVMFQDLPFRLERAMMQSGRETRPRGHKVHPQMIEEFIVRSGGSSDRRVSRGIAALICSSFVRDEIPWLYELSVEYYRATLTDDQRLERSALAIFANAAETALMSEYSRGVRISPSFARDIFRLIRTFVLSSPVEQVAETAIDQDVIENLN
jgi:hypothetical protein